jgi:hypothetical protein
MKKIIIILLFFFAALNVINAQETKPEFKRSGKIFGKIFVNYHYDFEDGSEQRNTFQLQRAYLGYKYAFSEKISVKVTLDAARRSAASSYTTFLKHAQLDWRVANRVKLSIGLIGLKQFDTQEKIWGHRYLFKAFQDEFKLGSSADLGVNAEIQIAKNLTGNFFVLNGEGYTNVQDPMGRIKAGGNLIYKPIKGLVLKGYFDVYGGNFQLEDGSVVDTVSVKTFNAFAGYSAKKFRIGAEYTAQLDGKRFNQQAADHDIFGISAFAIYDINKKFELFVDYLDIRSNILEGEDRPWDYKRDGEVIIVGLQYAPIKGIKMALNYRNYLHDKNDPDGEHEIIIPNGSELYLNVLYQF